MVEAEVTIGSFIISGSQSARSASVCSLGAMSGSGLTLPTLETDRANQSTVSVRRELQKRVLSSPKLSCLPA